MLAWKGLRTTSFSKGSMKMGCKHSSFGWMRFLSSQQLCHNCHWLFMNRPQAFTTYQTWQEQGPKTNTHSIYSHSPQSTQNILYSICCAANAASARIWALRNKYNNLCLCLSTDPEVWTKQNDDQRELPAAAICIVGKFYTKSWNRFLDAKACLDSAKQ